MKCKCGRIFDINPPERDKAPGGGEKAPRDEIDTGTLRIIDARRDNSLILMLICPFCEAEVLKKMYYDELLRMPRPKELHAFYGVEIGGGNLGFCPDGETRKPCN